MRILTHIQQNSYIIALSGSLDTDNASTVKSAMLEALEYQPKEVMVDCEDLEEISQKSLRSFISTIRNLQRNHVGIVLISVNQKLNNIFSMLGLDEFTNRISSSSLIATDEQYDIYFREI